MFRPFGKIFRICSYRANLFKTTIRIFKNHSVPGPFPSLQKARGTKLIVKTRGEGYRNAALPVNVPYLPQSGGL